MRVCVCVGGGGGGGGGGRERGCKLAARQQCDNMASLVLHPVSFSFWLLVDACSREDTPHMFHVAGETV